MNTAVIVSNQNCFEYLNMLKQTDGRVVKSNNCQAIRTEEMNH